MSFPFAPRPRWGRGTLASTCAVLALVGCGTTPRPAATSTLSPTPSSAASPNHALDAQASAAPAASARTEAPAAPIDWTGPVAVEQVLAQIRARHPSAAAARATVAVAEATVIGARAWDDPAAVISVGRTRGRVVGSEDDTPLALTVTQPFGAFGARSARIAAARAGVSVAEAEAAAALRDLDRAAARALLRMVAEDEALALADAHVRVAQDILVASERLVEAGEIGQADVARARAALVQTQANREVQISVRLTARDQVQRWLGEEMGEMPRLTGIWIDTAADAAAPAVPGEHPALLAVDARIKAAARALEAERAERWPQWSIGVEATREDEEDGVAMTLGFTLPVWNANAGGIASAQAERTRAIAEAAVLRLHLEQETAEARAALMQALSEQQALISSVVPAAREALRLQQAAYEAGVTDLPAVLDSQRALLDAEVQALASRRRAAEARIDLHVLLDGFAVTTQP